MGNVNVTQELVHLPEEIVGEVTAIKCFAVGLVIPALRIDIDLYEVIGFPFV